jgi:uncharacterized membrane protein YphA (DoxX/SURF4 family)
MKQPNKSVRLYNIHWITAFYGFLRVALGCIFIWAGITKVFNPKEFAVIIENYMILPDYLINPAALVLPWVEVVCGVCLIAGYYVEGSLVIVDILMIVFIIALGFNAYRGIDIDCGCFTLSGGTSNTNYAYYIFRDIVILGIGLLLLFKRISLKKQRISRI